MNQISGHILIVDDEPSVVYTLKCILEKVGYRISTAANTEEMVASLNTEAIDVIICDLGLNDEKGTTVLQRAREMQPDVGQIMLTGYAPQDVIDQLESQ